MCQGRQCHLRATKTAAECAMMAQDALVRHTSPGGIPHHDITLTFSRSCTSSIVHSSRCRLPVTVALGGLTSGLDNGVTSQDDSPSAAMPDAGVNGSSLAAEDAECSLAPPVEHSDVTEPLETEFGIGRWRGRP